MNDFKNLKEAHEVAACQRFLSIYNEAQNSDIKIVRLGDPNKKEPDCICGDSFAIELSGVYDNSYQAEKVWSVPRDKDIGQQPNHELLSLQNLQNEIGIKLSKLNEGNYAGFPEKIILVLNLQSPLLQDKEVEDYIDEICTLS
ncbi:MAG: hypothetical protein V1905_01290 [bacterium]